MGLVLGTIHECILSTAKETNAPTPKNIHTICILTENVQGLSSFEAAQKAIDAVKKLIRDLGLQYRLSDVDFQEEDLPQIAQDVIQTATMPIKLNNPRTVTAPDVLQILHRAL